MKPLDTNKMTFWIVAFLALFFIESTFLSNGNIIFLLLGAGFTYFGFKKRSKWMVFLRAFLHRDGVNDIMELAHVATMRIHLCFIPLVERDAC